LSFPWYYKVGFCVAFKGYVEQSAAEKVKAKMKLQLDETGMLVGPI